MNAIVVQSDQKRIVAGGFTQWGGYMPHVGRLAADGSLDASFAPVGSGLDGWVNAVAFDGSGPPKPRPPRA